MYKIEINKVVYILSDDTTDDDERNDITKPLKSIA